MDITAGLPVCLLLLLLLLVLADADAKELVFVFRLGEVGFVDVTVVGGLWGLCGDAV